MENQNDLRVEHERPAPSEAGPVVTSSRFVTVDGARVAYRVQGQGPTVILVNGTAALDVHWGPVIGELSKNRTVVSLDYSGSGDTVDDGSTLTLQKLANQVRAVAGASATGQFDVVGHSLGASVAVELAVTSPDLVRSLILVAGFPWGAEPRLRLQFELWLDLLRTNRRAFLRLLLLTGLTPAFISKLGVSAVEEMIAGYMQIANWEGLERQVALDLVADIRNQSGMVTCPTLVISCACDQIVTSTAELATYIPGSACREINAGHLAYFEGAQEFLATTEAFLGGRQRPVQTEIVAHGGNRLGGCVAACYTRCGVRARRCKEDQEYQHADAEQNEEHLQHAVRNEGRHAQSRLNLACGSSASRTPSPKRLSAKTVTTMARPGASETAGRV